MASPDPFTDVDRTASAAFAAQGISGMGLAVYDAQGVKRFEKMYGAFAPEQRIAIASASKMVAGLTILRLVDQGFLTLDSTTGSVLGWTGPQRRSPCDSCCRSLPVCRAKHRAH